MGKIVGCFVSSSSSPPSSSSSFSPFFSSSSSFALSIPILELFVGKRKKFDVFCGRELFLGLSSSLSDHFLKI